MQVQASPEAHRAWWNSYAAFMVHYARLAQSAHVEMLCIGTNLVHMTTGDPAYPEDWRRLIHQIRTIYHGPLTYAADWDTEFEGIVFWDALDFIGINAFVPLDASTGASSTELVPYWKTARERIEAVSTRIKKPVIFTEAGYRPVAECYQHPANTEGGTPDLVAQARANDALFLAFRDAPWWKGMYLYKAYTDPASEEPEEFAFRHRPAEKVIERWFGTQRKKGVL